MAIDLGIEMNECRIYEKGGLHHFMTKRFDRVNGDKVHMQTLAALGHFDYNTPNVCSYEPYADLSKRLGIGKSGIEQIFMRTVFAVKGGNCDDSDNDLMSFGRTIGLSAEFCRRTIARTDDVVSHWLEYAARCKISEERAIEIQSSLIN